MSCVNTDAYACSECLNRNNCSDYKAPGFTFKKSRRGTVDPELAKITDAMGDMVNNPPHYQTESGIETFDVIKAFTQGLDGIEAVCTGNIIKYTCRWKKKNGIQDLKKAEWYLKRLIRHMELEEANKKVEGEKSK